MINTIDQLYDEFLNSTGVNTDTRKIKEGNIFFALKGENFDANKFAKQALDSGAKLAVIDNPTYHVDNKTILVKDSLKTLQELAKHHREQLKIPVIGLTGSNGKTTTKELINAVLKKKYKTFSTEGNLNNHIGVPLSILSINNETEIAIIEMGANHVGEISFLCEISQPSHGLITNIGKAHIGEFGGFENIVRAKSELFHFLIKNHGQVFINSRQEILKNMSKRFNNPLFYPKHGDYYHCEFLSSSPFLSVETEQGKAINTQLIGNYNFDNVATALCLGKYFNVDAQHAAEAITNYQPTNNRSQFLTQDTNTIILDAYNANPSSMEVAIANLKEMTAENKMVILGDMLELGEDSEQEHRNIGKQLKDAEISTVLLCGKWMMFAKEEIPNANYFNTKDELIHFLTNHKYDNQFILVKGSRSMGLEKVIEYLKA